MRAIYKGKISEDFYLTIEQRNLLLDAFIDSNLPFNEETPNIIINDKYCIYVAIKRDINSINFISYNDKDLKRIATNEALKQGYILKYNSPDFLKTNIKIVINAIKLDLTSVYSIPWKSFNNNEINIIIDKIIECGYVLDKDSPNYLKNNLKIVLASIKKNIKCIEYASEEMKEHKEVFKYLIFNGYNKFSEDYFLNKPLSYLKDMAIMEYYFEKYNVYPKKSIKFKENFRKVYNDALNKKPTLKNFETFFQFSAEENWKKYRKENLNKYDNVFGKICSELKNDANLDNVINNLNLLCEEMKIILKTRYDELYDAMKEYSIIYHSNVPNKLEKIQSSKNVIGELSSLYIAKSKENYKKMALSEYYSILRTFYKINKENPFIKKRIVETNQRKYFKQLYLNKNQNILSFIDELIERFSSLISENEIRTMINRFIIQKISDFSKIRMIPQGYDKYQKYKKTIKLINRLNNGYIDINGFEVTNYKKFIKYDDNLKKYICYGISFDDYEIEIFDNYAKCEKIFNDIKKEIMLKIKTIEINEELEESILDNIIIPFKDEYYAINSDKILENFTFLDLKSICNIGKSYNYNTNSFTTNDSYNIIYNFLVNKGLIWLLIFINQSEFHNLKENIQICDISKIINNMKNIIILSKEFNLDLNNYEELFLTYKISKYADNESLLILGKEIIEKLYKCKKHTTLSSKRIIQIAKEMVYQMVQKNKSTVPYITGKTMNYNYSLYDSQDETILISGINTDSCFKIDGNDNDFMHYCVLNKNGFVLKINDSYNNFVAKASGFRNGNCIFINQLRTIYDESGGSYKGEYENEKKDIIDTFKKACEDFVTISQNNLEEENKIDFVFVTQSYILDDYKSNVTDEISNYIGDFPMNTTSNDWKEFFDKTKNLQGTKNGFITDYGNYPLICMASSKKIEDIKVVDINKKDNPALYKRKRNKIVVTNQIDIDVYQKINKISAINSYYNKTTFTLINIPKNSIVFTGDNWYIIYNNCKITNYCILDFDENALIEFKTTLEIINKYKLDNIKKINLEQIENDVNLSERKQKL